MNFLDLIWLIPLIPLFGAALMLLIGRRLPNSGGERSSARERCC